MESESTLLIVNIKEFCKLLENEMEDEEYSPLIGLGRAGVGKTVSIRETAEKHGWGYKELRLCNLSEIDLIGIPTIDEYGGTTYATNSMLPRADRDGEVGILVLDEITSCSPSLRANALQLMDSSRGIGNYKLPEKWKIVCLGNGRDDGGVNYQGIEEAVTSRGMSYKITTSIEDWKEWAIKKGVNSAVTAYLSWKPISLYVKVDDDDEDIKAFPCPRTWELLSNKLNKREKANGGRLPRQMVQIYASGCVGINTGSEFAGFYETIEDSVSIEDLIKGNISGAKIAELKPQIAYATLANIVDYIRENKENIIKEGKEQPDAMKYVKLAVDTVLSLSHANLEYAISLLTDVMHVDEFQIMFLSSDKFNDEYGDNDELENLITRYNKVMD